MVFVRACAVWLLIMAAETAHRILRALFLVPWIGDFPARQFSVFTGSLLIFLIALLTIRWIGARSIGELVGMGALWIALTIGFEIGVGRFVAGFPWSRILEDFDVSRGGMLGLGLLFMGATPLLAAKLRGWPPSDRS